MRPDKKILGLLGLTDAAIDARECLSESGHDDGVGRGHRRADDPVPRDGRPLHAERRDVPLATLYSNATTATSNPAVTLRSFGTNGGQAVAFAYDLARSVVYTRQGNPAWAGQERDGAPGIRPDDMFFGGSQTDWVNTSKIAIPQADEQQRLLANVITLHESRPDAFAAILVPATRQEGCRRCSPATTTRRTTLQAASRATSTG